MNYLSHSLSISADDPYAIAGCALPDWMNVVARSVRVRKKLVLPHIESPHPQFRQLACGVVQHHWDDDWFHRTLAFAELTWAFTVVLRDHLQPEPGLRPSFLAHILVEILLDDVVSQRAPETIRAYYETLGQIAPKHVRDFVKTCTGCDVPGLEGFIPRFLELRFLYDYADDAKLLFRLNQIMQRVGLVPLPTSVSQLFPTLRGQVAERSEELLTPPQHTLANC